MSRKILFFLVLFFSVFVMQCKKKSTQILSDNANQIKYANGFKIQNYKGYSILKISNPWPNANEKFTYILKEKNGIVPDSLQDNIIISVPIKKIVVTSTTHIPSLEMLKQERTLVGFPNLNYISSKKIRTLIDLKKIADVGTNHSLNIEKIIELQPELIVGYGIDNHNPELDNLQKSGLKVVFNGDWNEQSPLGKAEWIKFFGALFCKQNMANEIFKKIESDYLKTIEIAKKASIKPSILAGDIFDNNWYLPKGESWGSLLLLQASGNYLWKNSKGSGSLSLSFETVFEKAKNADFWITSGQHTTLQEMSNANKNYSQFKAFQTKNVYSFATKKGKTGGILYYELGPNRPDIVLKDLVKILHPELLVGYKPYFFEKLQ